MIRNITWVDLIDVTIGAITKPLFIRLLGELIPLASENTLATNALQPQAKTTNSCKKVDELEWERVNINLVLVYKSFKQRVVVMNLIITHPLKRSDYQLSLGGVRGPDLGIDPIKQISGNSPHQQISTTHLATPILVPGKL